MQYKLVVSKYYSEKRGLVKLRYNPTLVLDSENGACLEYKTNYGRKCKMNFYKNDNGYLWTSLALEDHTKISGRLNRLVYSNVYGEIPKGYEVDHKDRNRANNFPYNLRLLTKSENNLNKDIKGDKNAFSKLSNNDARNILELYLQKKSSMRNLAVKYGVCLSTVKHICSGRNWYAINKDIFDKYGLEVIRR